MANMRQSKFSKLGLIAGLALSSSVFAQSAADSNFPGTIACPEAVAEIATCYSARLESGAYVLAAMPKRWNRDLIVFAHGGPSLAPATAASSKGDLSKYAFEVERGFGWVASSYRHEGYGIQMAAADTDDARKFFIARLGKPKRTLIHGASYGGLVAAKLIETHAKNADGSLNYDGAFLNSGLVSGSAVGYEFRADLRAVYQYYCKNLPRPGEQQYPLWLGIPADSKLTAKDMEARVEECTGVSKAPADRTELQKQNLANIVGVMGFSERLLTRHMQAATFIFRDVATRITHGKSAFTNMGIAYRGSSDDAALNRDVARFDADHAARDTLKADGQPTGALPIPMVAIHSINDPQVVVEVESAYRDAVRRAGNADRLVQAYTDENQHTGQSGPEIIAALEMLLQWIEMDYKPDAAIIAEACEQMRSAYDGPCRYHPDFQPKAYGTKYYTRDAVAR
jgi:pimeloyl-ACP methyl ester carboxylesterase